jgi:hypothetical protein
MRFAPRVTGTSPLATQRRVESILTPPGENRHFLPPPLPNFAPPSSPFNSILERSHSIAIFAFFFRYFSSTRPNEFFQIQAYLIHWFRLLALLFSLFAAADGAFPVAVGPEPQDHARRCGAYRTAARPGNARLGSKPAVISALVSGPQSSDVSSAR